MDCEKVTFQTKNGPVTAIVCGARRRRTPCRSCGAPDATLLCDFPVGPGATCDAPICWRCAMHAGADLDYCPTHAADARQPHQLALFGPEASR